MSRLTSLHFPVGGIKKVQRVSDVKAMGYVAGAAGPAYGQNQFQPDNSYSAQPSQQPLQQPSQPGFDVGYGNPTGAASNYYDPYANPAPPAYSVNAPQQTYAPSAYYDPNSAASMPQPGMAAPFAMLQQPVVQDMALQYGQKLADHGKQLVESHFEKYIPVTRLKYYFAVDNNYVVKKLILLLFPFTHRVSVKCFSVCGTMSKFI